MQIQTILLPEIIISFTRFANFTAITFLEKGQIFTN